MDEQTIIALAQQALAFLATEPSRVARFLTVTGLDPEMVRQRVGDRDFLAGVLQFLREDESLLLVFAAEMAIKPERVAEAQAKLERMPVA
jgi:hypothetical protein